MRINNIQILPGGLCPSLHIHPIACIDVRCRKTLDNSDIVDVKLYECTRTQYIEAQTTAETA